MSSASIVLLTYNAERYLGSVLQMLRRQKKQPLEIVAIDSSSTDSTREILSQYDVRPHIISKDEFGHAQTRNKAVRMCSGKYVVFLTQDAVPADACWLECLLAPLERAENIVASFSRQIPRPCSSLLEANDLSQDFPSKSTVKRLEGQEALEGKKIWPLIRFSNSSSAYARDLLLNNPFDETLEMAEDQEWVKRILEKGFAVVYQATSVVVHSHEHGLHEKYNRSFAMGASFSRFLKAVLGQRSTILETGAWLVHVLLDMRYIATCNANFGTRLKWLILSPVHRAVSHYAFRKGWNSTCTTCSLREKGTETPAAKQRLLVEE